MLNRMPKSQWVIKVSLGIGNVGILILIFDLVNIRFYINIHF